MSQSQWQRWQGEGGVSDTPPPGRGGRRGGNVLATAVSWGAGLLVMFLGSMLAHDLVYEPLATPARMESFVWGVLIVHLPDIVVVALATWLAARLHREPYRGNKVAHLVAALTVPVFTLLLTYATDASLPGESSVFGLVMTGVVGAVGMVVGYGVDQLGEGRE